MSFPPATRLRGAISTTRLSGGGARLHVAASNLTPHEAVLLGRLVADVAHLEQRPSGLHVIRHHDELRPRVREH